MDGQTERRDRSGKPSASQRTCQWLIFRKLIHPCQGHRMQANSKAMICQAGIVIQSQNRPAMTVRGSGYIL